jgi:dihydrofolate reductase/thymidylate synthase
MELIVAMDSQNGIGYKDGLPWRCPEDLKYFRETTLNKTVIVGRKTAQSLPVLKRRRVLCLTRGKPNAVFWKNDVTFIHSLDSDSNLGEIETKETVIVAGGAGVYQTALKTERIRRVYRTIIQGTFKSDTYFDPKWLYGFVVTKEEVSSSTGNIYQVLEPAALRIRLLGRGEPRHRHAGSEYQYLELLNDVCTVGTGRESRNGATRALFMSTLKFDLRDGFPILTTKKMFIRGILEEFLFFLRGDTDSTSLSNARVRIWEGNTSKEFLTSQSLPYAPGVMGPMYGYQWRHFNAPYLLDGEGRPLRPKGGIDQLANVVHLIKNDPHSRRILMTSYNPAQASQGVLYPCHSITIQFYVQDVYLDMSCYNRSQDLFLGVPYNIASSALLLSVVARLTSKTPRYLSMVMGDTHLYECHVDQARLQAKRIPYVSPSLEIPNIESLDEIPRLKASDFKLKDYKSHKSIKAAMVA